MQMQCRPHLMLAHIGGKSKGLALRHERHLMHRPGNGQAVLVVVVFVRLTPGMDLLPPFSQVTIGFMLHQQGKDRLHIPSQPQ